LVRRPWASRTENVAAQVAPGASCVHAAITDVADATLKLTPMQAPTGRTSKTSSGVRGSGLTSPGALITETAQVDPAACVHCWVRVPPWGRVEGAAPTRRMRRTGATAGWLVTEIIAASSAPGTARSAPTTVTREPSSDTSNADPA
jgi:hypothetical protein